MKRLTGGLALLLALCLSGNVQANIVIDDFSLGGVDTNAPSTSRDATFVTGQTVPIITAPGFGFVNAIATNAGQAFTLNYDVAVPPTSSNGNGFGFNRFLELDLNATGTWEVTFSIDNGGGSPGNSVTPTTIADGSTSVIVDLSSGDNTGNLNGLTDLALTFTNIDAIPDLAGMPGTGTPGSLLLSNIAAVPEPTSFALLGITCLGGGAAATRRRRRKELAA